MIIQCPVYFSAAIVALSTSYDLTFKVPGTFAGLVPSDPTAGRYFKSFHIWADIPIVTNRLDSLKLVDTDGVVPVPARAAFPNYPNIIEFFSAEDVAAGLLNGCYFHPDDGLKIEPFNEGGQSVVQFLPAGLYLVATIRGNALQAFRGNLVWGRYLSFG